MAVDNKVFYAAADPAHGEELWISDGTPRGTFMVKDIQPGPTPSSPQNFVSFKGRLFFTAYSHEHGDELWSSDGTLEGTALVTDLNANVNGSIPRSLVVFKNYLYFTIEGGLYKSDGSAAGTTLVERLDYYRPSILAVSDEYLYYSLFEPNIIRRSNGTTVTTIPQPEHIDGNTSFHSLYAAGDNLIAFRTSSYEQDIRLYGYDEVNSEWTLVFTSSAPMYGDQEFDNFLTVDNKLFFSLRIRNGANDPADQLWVSDGTVDGTKMLTSFHWMPHMYGSEMDHFTEYQNAVYFRSSEGGAYSLWKSDGTPSGTIKVHDVRVSRHEQSLRTPMVVSNELLWFCGSMNEYGSSGELWNSDGTAAGTRRYTYPDPKQSLPSYLLTDASGILYFVTGSSYSGTTLWNSAPAGEISISTIYNNPIASGETLYLNSPVETDCITLPLIIHNGGYKELALSQLFVTGKEFYVKGTLPEFLEPDQKVTIDVYFNPLSLGEKTGEIIVNSNDLNEPRYSIKLRGELKATDQRKICKAFDGTLVKSLAAGFTTKAITLSSSVVNEMQPAPTLVGSLSVPGFSGPVTYALSEGKGDEGNAYFMIEGNQLKTNLSFDQGEKNLYAVRVRATTSASSVEETFTVKIIDVPTVPIPISCDNVAENMNYALTDTEFNDNGELFAITNDGRILRSSNEGESWDVLNSGRWGWLSRIFFKGSTGYITGQTLLKSEDNGATWFQLYLPFELSYEDVTAFFLDDKRGFVTGPNGHLAYTPDGGHSWDIRHVGSYSDAFRQPWFFDENNGLAFRGGTVLNKTTDGGRTWEYVNVGTNPAWTGMWFTDDKHGFITSYYNTYRTSDGGKSWVGVPEVAGDYFSRVEFADERNGYIYGGNYSPLLYITTDGGESWTQATNHPGPGRMTGVSRSPAGKIFSVQAFTYGEGFGRSLNVSPDGGATWEILDELASDNFYKIDFFTEDVGLLLGQNGRYKTVDKGRTWTKFEWTPQPIYSFHFFDEHNGLLSDGFIIYKTTDGGVTMDEVLVTTSSPDPHYVPAGQLYPVTNDVIFSYSDYALYRSQDGGDNWDLMTYDYDFYAQDMQFLSATVGYRMELFGGLVKTVDGGTTWSELYTRNLDEPVDPYVTLFFVDENTGYKAGRKVSKTTDGGITWTIMYTNFYGDIFDIYFTDVLHGYAATRHRTLYETFDGGVTWEEISLGVGSSYDGLYGIQHKHGNIYLVGPDGYVAQISNPNKKPTQPGYAVGPGIVCGGDSYIYHLSENNSGTYQWNVTGGAVVNDLGTSAFIQFPHAGEYVFTINSLNECGVSTPRVQSIKVVSLPLPDLAGPEIIESLSPPAAYEVRNLPDDLIYTWDVTGAKAFTNEDSPRSTVTWELGEYDAAVTVLVTDPVSGCRVLENLDVEIDVQLSVEHNADDIITLYPNPTPGELRIISKRNEPLSMKLYSSSGREYFKGALAPLQESTLQLQHLPAGLYLVEITNGNGRKITRKIVKQ